MATSALFALGLALMALAGGPVGLFAAWLVMGVAMGSGLYEAAFASLVRLYGHDARNAITGITLIAGFASTVGWPLTAALEHAWGWRGACWAWAGAAPAAGPAAQRLAAPGGPAGCSGCGRGSGGDRHAGPIT